LLPVQRVAGAAERLLASLRSGMQTLKKHPLPLALAVLGVLLFKPASVWRWGGRGLFLWRSWRALRPWLALFQSRL
jgi:hypothetical protein